MRVYPPRFIAPVYARDGRNPELVKWSPDIQKYIGGRWRTVRVGAWWAAAISSYGYVQRPGMGAWSNGMQNASFYGLSRGSYRAVQYVWWQQLGSTHRYHNGTCRFY